MMREGEAVDDNTIYCTSRGQPGGFRKSAESHGVCCVTACAIARAAAHDKNRSDVLLSRVVETVVQAARAFRGASSRRSWSAGQALPWNAVRGEGKAIGKI